MRKSKEKMAHHARHRLPKLRETGDGSTRRLVKDFHASFSLLHVVRISVAVRAGFVTDGASIPMSLRRWIGNPFDHVRLIAAVVHDALYASQILPRIFADLVYYLALRQCSHMPRAYAAAEYLALRKGGKPAWREKTPQQIAENRKLVRVRVSVLPISNAANADHQPAIGN